MVQELTYLPETPSQTAGPYVHIGLIPQQAGFDIFDRNFSHVLVKEGTKGERIRIEGTIFDATDTAIHDALIEIWQANAAGRYNHPLDKQSDKPIDETFRGWGRTGSDFQTGLYTFETIKPGRIAGRAGRGTMAPHVNFWIVARGINIGLSTRMYFADEEEANAGDPVLRMIEPHKRRATLIAPRATHGGVVVYRFDIHLQGERETVFFDV